MGYHGEFKEDKLYYYPVYGKIEYDGKNFRILKSRIKKEYSYPISIFHDPLQERLRFLNSFIKYYRENDRHLNIGLGIADYEVLLHKLPIKLYSIEQPNDPVFKEEITQKNIAISKTQVSSVDICESALPYEDNFFNSISLLETFEYLPVDKITFAISEITRILKIGGYLYLSTPNLASLENRLALLFKGKLFLSMPKKTEAISGHLRVYTFNEIKDFFQSFNYNIIEQIFFQITSFMVIWPIYLN